MPAPAVPAKPATRRASAAARPDGRRRSSPASSATASRRASIAATSSRPTPPAGSSASSATPTGWSRCARRSSRSGCVALIEAGGIATFDLEPAEIAIMASSHSGEDLHVRTLQGLYRRSGVSQTLLACGSEGAPLDELTAARLARDGEKAGPVRHMCSGQHTVSLLLSRLRGWDPTEYWKASHPSQIAYRAAVARAYGTTPTKLRTAIDGCGVETYAFHLREVARAYAMLADPKAIPADDPRSEVAGVADDHPRRDAGQPRDGRRAARPPGHLADEGRARTGWSARPGWRPSAASRSCPGREAGPARRGATGMAIKIEDGDGYDRGTWAATVEALRQAGVRRRRRPARPRPLPPPDDPRSARPCRCRDDRRVRARAGG